MSSYVREIQQSDFDREVLQSDRPVALDFFSTECDPCEALAPKYEAVAEQFGEKARFLKIFRQGNKDLAKQLGVTGSPTLVFFNKGKEQGDRLSGDIARSAIKRAIEGLLQG